MSFPSPYYYYRPIQFLICLPFLKAPNVLLINNKVKDPPRIDSLMVFLIRSSSSWKRLKKINGYPRYLIKCAGSGKASRAVMCIDSEGNASNDTVEGASPCDMSNLPKLSNNCDNITSEESTSPTTQEVGKSKFLRYC